MSVEQFQNLAVGTKFRYNNTEYVKIENERVSCCRNNNAVMVADATQKTQIAPITEVEVLDE